MTKLLKRNIVFISLSLALLIALGLALLIIPKGELHILLCDHHTPHYDVFFRYYTPVAEWLPYVMCLLILLFCRVGDAVFAAAGQALSALTTQIIKHIVVAPRPLTWFANNMPDMQLPLADGVQMQYWYSFPSGHTTSFFALFFTLSVILTQTMYNNQTTKGLAAKHSGSIVIQLLLFMLAALGGYSRIYLSQHFASDVFGGICVGLLITIVCYAIFSRMEDKKWYNYRLLSKK